MEKMNSSRDLKEMIQELNEATVEYVAKINKRLDGLEKETDDVMKKMQRPSQAAMGESTEAAEHRRAYAAYLRKGYDAGLPDLQVKALSVGVDADGGYAVPEDLDRAVSRIEIDEAPMEGIVNVKPVANELYEKIISLGGTASGWVGETAARGETASSTLASFKPTFGEIYANPKATQKLLDDASFEVEEWASEEIGREFASKIDVAIISGDGTNKPKGILSYTVSATPTFGQLKEIKSGSAGAVVADKLIEVSTSLKPGYLKNARWVMSTATLRLVRQLKDTTNQYLFQPGLQAGQPNTLLGYPITLDENMPTPAASSKSILFGDFKRGYKLAVVRNFRILRDPYTAKPYVHFYATKRVGGGCEDTTALIVHTLGV